jgi:predicted RNA-binding Zn-ribbon protein involved in translation (DUF1610 family)
MLETTFDLRYSGRDVCVIVESSGAGDVGKEAELASFAYYATETIAWLGPRDADSVVQALTSLDGVSTEYLENIAETDEEALLEGIGSTPVRVLPPDRAFRGENGFRVLLRFLNARRGPRVFLQVKTRGRVRGERKRDLRASSVPAVLVALLRRRAMDTEYVHRLALAAALVGKVAATGRITEGNELDVALATANVASQSVPASAAVADSGEELECSECGYAAPADWFGQRLWPGDRASISRCPNCGSGLWSRARRRVRRIPHDVWVASEELREDVLRLRDSAPNGALENGGGETPLLEELKTRFEENGWPYSEVLGLPVLVSDLSGPLGIWKFYAQVVDAQNVVLLFSVCPLRVPSNRRAEASLFLTHANHGLVAGNFELDFDDGEIRYKTVLQTHDAGIDRATLKSAVRSNGLAMETYLPGIGAVITGASARAALERRTNDH